MIDLTRIELPSRRTKKPPIPPKRGKGRPRKVPKGTKRYPSHANGLRTYSRSKWGNWSLDLKDYVNEQIDKGGFIPCPLELSEILKIEPKNIYAYMSVLRKEGYSFKPLGMNRGYIASYGGGS